MNDDDSCEVVDSCDGCGVDIYEDEFDGTGMCYQCQWWVTEAEAE